MCLDEHEHVNNNIKVLHSAVYPFLSELEKEALIAKTKQMVNDFVEAEVGIVELLGEQEGITLDDWKGYIQYLGKLRLFQLGYIGSVEVPENPMKWMDSMLSAERHGAFFEKRITDYSHKKLEGSIDYSKYLNLVDK